MVDASCFAINRLYNMDCMEGMKHFPNNYFELAIVDPPYGSGKSADINNNRTNGRFGKYKEAKIERTGGTWAKKYGRHICTWDIAPPSEYFTELFRVSKCQIIWGGNYFNLPSTRMFVVWDKQQSENFSMAMAEYAWCSFDGNAKIFRCKSNGKPGERFHPTQKPVKLYEWLLSKYAKPKDKILDTHVGSASSLIACHRMGFDFVGFEIDRVYYELASERLGAEMVQMGV